MTDSRNTTDNRCSASKTAQTISALARESESESATMEHQFIDPKADTEEV